MAEESKLQSESLERLREARRWKEGSGRILDFKEAYFFSAPWRQRQISSQSPPPQSAMLDQPDLYTDLAFLLCGDFITEIVNTYMPEAQMWCERRAGMDVPDEVFAKIKDDVDKADKKIFDAIKASNFYAELPKALNPDLAIAGAGLYIDRRKTYLPITALAVPMREMEINLGPDGEIDDRFIIRYSYNKYVRSLIGEEAWGNVKDEIKKAIEDKPSERTQIGWGWWRLWQRDDNEVWQHVVMLQDKVIHDTEIKGEGCCPFIVMRFNPTADWPWAHGPMLQFIPTLRQVDELTRQKVEAVERAVNPAITFPDDSFAQVEQGIEPGMAYQIRPGTEDAVKRIYDQPTIEPEVYQLETMEKRLRKGFYVDLPEQTGDTPPTLGQWLEEMARAQRRIGTPGMSFWREGPAKIFLRFKYLLEASGTIPALKDPTGRMISTQPYNPTQRAAEQQEIATAVQMAQIGAQMFPEEWKLVVNGKDTIEAFADKMRVNGLIKMRSKEEIAAALAQIAQLQGGQQAGATPPAGAGAPGPA